MVELYELISEIIQSCPDKSDLSIPRITKILYLIDWKYALKTKKQLSSIEWLNDEVSGPYSLEVYNTIDTHTDLYIVKDFTNNYGHKKEIISLVKTNYKSNLTEDIKSEIQLVIDETSDFNWKDFLEFVRQTYPIKGFENEDWTKIKKLNLEFYAQFVDLLNRSEEARKKIDENSKKMNDLNENMGRKKASASQIKKFKTELKSLNDNRDEMIENIELILSDFKKFKEKYEGSPEKKDE